MLIPSIRLLGPSEQFLRATLACLSYDLLLVMGLLNFCVSAVGMDRDGRKGRRWICICIAGKAWMVEEQELIRRPSDANDDDVFRLRSIADYLLIRFDRIGLDSI